MNELRFFVSGKPIAKARPRVVRNNGRSHTFTDERTAAWEQLVRWVARVEAHKRRWRPTADPCEVEIALRGLNPRSDVDNAAKAVLDALNGLAWDDDRRVWSLLVRRDETLAADGALVIVRRAMPLRGAALPGTFESEPGEDVYECEAPGDWPSVAPEIACGPVLPARRLHLTEKPVHVMEAIVGIVPKGGLVLDPFTGSGSTGAACMRRGRAFAGCELSPHYHALASRRLEAEARGVDGTAAAKDGQLPLLGGAS